MSGRWPRQFQARVAQVFERIRLAVAIGAPPRPRNAAQRNDDAAVRSAPCVERVHAPQLRCAPALNSMPCCAR
ncbi:hypothetical protein XarbCFBP7408_06015 [Xanthomonas arboricola pv. guizotiae]|uniref:Uncharacterized protein n=1 Tax=Xanthomonas arboricola pv. guizotiae TaxID=487867 RepID=A0A2S7A5U9_9XANT|nr:hypothetical protein XarbCFBP7409_04410 [Xanthomonas arboricola pv. guizotiae]PPU25285.1 hypothetical protein XarbCFBP7408_06015 [Xanthomonas arboricola pv. guizotiae]